MSNETELKLSVPLTEFDDLKAQSFWSECATGEPVVQQLGNTYFDTADFRLNKARVALRIRQVDGTYIQTLKTRGTSVDGLSRRGEWEWQRPTPTLDVTLLRPHLPAPLHNLQAEELQPLFTTHFTRTAWQILWQSSHIEAAMDRGDVSVPHGDTLPICELELELKDGDERDLLDLAKRLQSLASLTPSDQSKAEKGFTLLNAH